MSLRVAILGQLPETLLTQLSALAPQLDLIILGQAPDRSAALAALAAPVADIAIVGTSFADGSGFSFVRALAAGQRPVGVVFVGAREDEAVMAFELQATDFVLWPAPSGRLQDALTRARQQVLQLALLRTADELQRLLSEASQAGGVDLTALFGARQAATGTGNVTGNGTGNGNGISTGIGTSHGASQSGDAATRRRAGGGSSTGTLIASAPQRGSARGMGSRTGRRRDPSEDGVLDLSQEGGGRGGSDSRPLRVLVREGRRTRFVPLADVDWFEADGNYIRVHTGAEKYRTRGTITAIESALDPRQFVRIHRRIVVNMDRVREMSPLPGGDGLLVLGNGSTLRLSRTYRSRVR